MGVYDQMMYSYDAGIKQTLPEQYIQRKAMKNVQPNLGYLKDAELVEQPLNGGKHVRMWRYTALPAVTMAMQYSTAVFRPLAPKNIHAKEAQQKVTKRPFNSERKLLALSLFLRLLTKTSITEYIA